MKTQHQHITVIIEKDEDGFYVGSVPSLRSCYTQAKTLEELYPRIKEAVELCLEVEKPTPMQFIGVQQLEI